MTLREMLATAIHEAWCAEEGLCDGTDLERADDLAIELQTQLRQHGYAIHDVQRCIRLEQVESGRMMTPAEAERMIGERD